MTAKISTADAPPELKEGVEVQLSNGLQATVAEVTPDHVIIDANHALAGKDLNFEVEIVQLQKACSHSLHLIAYWQFSHTAVHLAASVQI